MAQQTKTTKYTKQGVQPNARRAPKPGSGRGRAVTKGNQRYNQVTGSWELVTPK